ncbi:MAG: alpha/beta hydrolase [Proteobacteria bacterium]|nr:alpha/beta hydrolase [Pseudomonadota bacterium]
MSAWCLSRRAAFGEDEIAWDRFGEGPPLVLVHGFPSNSFVWRDVAPRLAESRTVYVFDMMGFGASSQREGQDMFIRGQARVLNRLLDHWGLDRPEIAGHDIGAAVVAMAHAASPRFRRIALLSAAIVRPCVTENTRHVQSHIEAYRTMPPALYQGILTIQIRSADFRPMPDTVVEAYRKPWTGAAGQAAYYRFVGQMSDVQMAQAEEAVTGIEVPTLILWGTEDSWTAPERGDALERLIPDSHQTRVAGGGHFVMDDEPVAVADALDRFFVET